MPEVIHEPSPALRSTDPRTAGSLDVTERLGVAPLSQATRSFDSVRERYPRSTLTCPLPSPARSGSVCAGQSLDRQAVIRGKATHGEASPGRDRMALRVTRWRLQCDPTSREKPTAGMRTADAVLASPCTCSAHLFCSRSRVLKGLIRHYVDRGLSLRGLNPCPAGRFDPGVFLRRFSLPLDTRV